MKTTLMRSAAMLALALGLASCGGGGDGGDYTVRGTVVGLAYTGLKLTNGGDTIDVAPAGGGNVSYAFPTKLDYADMYHVKVASKPEHQTCAVVTPGLESGEANYGRDSAGRLTEINVVVQCAVDTHAVIVSIPKPLKGLQLTNGSLGGTITLDGTEVPVAPATVVKKAFIVAYGDSYGITILKQPETGGPCRVDNGVGVMGDLPVDTATVVCP